MSREREVKSHFDEEAKIYDELITGIIPYYREMVEALVDAIPVSGDSDVKVLDLGCGTGTVAGKIKERYPGASVTCMDVAPNMLEEAKERLKGYDNLDFVQGDFYSLSEEESYHVIVSSLALHHLESDEDKKQNYRSIYRALKKGGAFYNADIVSGPGEFTHRLYLEKWKEHMRKSFSEEEIEKEMIPRHKREDRPTTIFNHLKWLQETGFKEVEVVWKYYQLAVYGGVK